MVTTHPHLSLIHILLKQINNIHPKMQFTEEKEKHNKINYLDITITRDVYKRQLLFLTLILPKIRAGGKNMTGKS